MDNGLQKGFINKHLSKNKSWLFGCIRQPLKMLAIWSIIWMYMYQEQNFWN